MRSGAGAVLDLRVVLSLVGLSVTGSELVVKEGSKSTTVAVVSAACLRGQGETKKRVRDSNREKERKREEMKERRERDGHIVRTKNPKEREGSQNTHAYSVSGGW